MGPGEGPICSVTGKVKGHMTIWQYLSWVLIPENGHPARDKTKQLRLCLMYWFNRANLWWRRMTYIPSLSHPSIPHHIFINDEYMMASYHLYGGHRIPVALDSLHNCIRIVTDRFIIDVENQEEGFTTGSICIDWVVTWLWEQGHISRHCAIRSDMATPEHVVSVFLFCEYIQISWGWSFYCFYS